VETTELALERVLAFGRAVKLDLPAVDSALVALRAARTRAGVPYVAGGGELELAAGRHQDLADVVGLLRDLDEVAYHHVEAAVDVSQRAQLASLWDDALEERRWRG
jgi:hypothetical protein